MPRKPLMERSTRQRTAIRAAIDTAGRPLSAEEVLASAQHHVAALGIATVYRNLKLLLEEGAIQLVSLPGEIPHYESVRSDHDHHHHFQCRRCERVFDVHDCPGSLKHLAPKGFVIESHDITLYGTCAECSAAPRAGQRKSGARR